MMRQMIDHRRKGLPSDQLSSQLTADGHILDVRVYYEDTDFAGIVYHANYLRYCERGRSDFLRLAGIDQMALFAGLEGEPVSFAVRRMTIDFLQPAKMNDILRVETQLGHCGGARMTMLQNVFRRQDLVFSANVDVALVKSNGRPARLPESIRLPLAPFIAKGDG